MRITQGADNIGAFSKSSNAVRRWCKTCGGHLMTEHPEWNLSKSTALSAAAEAGSGESALAAASSLIDVYAATIPSFRFQPGVHVHYQETVLPQRDGLPKMKDLPSEMGGSGVVLPD